MARVRGKRGIPMPDERAVPPGAHRDMLAALHQLYAAAGRPGLRPMSIGIKGDNFAPTTLQHQVIGKILNGKALPNPRQLATLIGWLSREGNPRSNRADYSSQFIEDLLHLRAAAEDQVSRMQEGGHAEGFPHEQIFTNAHAERQALAGMLHSGGQAADAAAMVRVGDFTQVEHRIVFESITAIQKRDENYTLEEISQQIKAFGNWPNEEDLDDFLQELFHSLEDRRQTEAHAQTVGERSLLRRIYAAGQMISQIASTAASKESLDVNSILETIKHEIESLIPESADSPQPAEAFEQPEDGAETWSAQNISSGLRDLDALTSGFRSGCLTIIAGALSMGKTTLGADLARRCSVANGQTAVLFSLQMTRDDIATRLLAAEAQVSLSAMQSNRLSDSDWNRLAQRQAAVSEAPLYIADSPTFSIQGLRQTCKRLRRDRDLRLVIIDSIDLLTQSDELGEPRSGGGLLKLTNSLRLLARELGIPVIGLYQLGRLPEGRWSDAKPTLRDLPVEIENFADMVILLHREDAYEKESPRAGEADLIVAKNRHGRTGVAITAFQGHYARFVDMYDPFSS